MEYKRWHICTQISLSKKQFLESLVRVLPIHSKSAFEHFHSHSDSLQIVAAAWFANKPSITIKQRKAPRNFIFFCFLKLLMISLKGFWLNNLKWSHDVVIIYLDKLDFKPRLYSDRSFFFIISVLAYVFSKKGFDVSSKV